jgi:hypothetical protein
MNIVTDDSQEWYNADTEKSFASNVLGQVIWKKKSIWSVITQNEVIILQDTFDINNWETKQIIHDSLDWWVRKIEIQKEILWEISSNTVTENITIDWESILSDRIDVSWMQTITQSALNSDWATTALSFDNWVTWTDFTEDHWIVSVPTNSTEMMIKIKNSLVWSSTSVLEYPSIIPHNSGPSFYAMLNEWRYANLGTTILDAWEWNKFEIWNLTTSYDYKHTYAFTKNFTIYTSDDNSNWTQIYQFNNQSAAIVLHEISATSRYLKYVGWYITHNARYFLDNVDNNHVWDLNVLEYSNSSFASITFNKQVISTWEQLENISWMIDDTSEIITSITNNSWSNQRYKIKISK